MQYREVVGLILIATSIYIAFHDIGGWGLWEWAIGFLALLILMIVYIMPFVYYDSSTFGEMKVGSALSDSKAQSE